MYLSRLLLDARNPSVRRDLADCQQMHRTILSAFGLADQGPGGARLAFGVLFRIEEAPDGVMIYVQSREKPAWQRLPEGYLLPDVDRRGGNPAVRDVGGVIASFASGRTLRFRLLANATRKVHPRRRDGSERKNGTRVPLRDDRERAEWLRRKAADSGFELLHVSVSPGVDDIRQAPRRRVRGSRLDGAHRSEIEFEGVLYDGRLRVGKPGRFRDALERGIGPGKAYGFGLLSLAPG
jgi:CRISPR system Cascade subunit CasE